MLQNFYIANMSFNAIRENKILAKISEFTLLRLVYWATWRESVILLHADIKDAEQQVYSVYV